MSAEAVGMDGLTGPQREAVPMLAVGTRGIDVAESVGVTPETVSRWMKQKVFRAAVARAVADMDHEATGYLRELTMHALGVLEELLKAGDPAVRSKAAIAILQTSGISRAMKAAAHEEVAA